ncbi:MAG: hypothetical protein E3J37_09650 [Anaerolineales bacterium]|nr:MAG: hypothetical protein E3J37_09650 [Anaerolineales bacterium]
MGEVQERVGKNGKGEDEPQNGENKRNKQKEEGEVARGVIQRLRRGELRSEREREGAPMDFPDEELDVPNLDVPDNQ